MEPPAPLPKPKRERGYYGTRWKRAKEAFHRITAISTKENKALLGMEQAPSTGVSKAIAALDALVAGHTADVRGLEAAVGAYDRAVNTYNAMLTRAANVTPPAFVEKPTYLAAIKTLQKELKAIRLELNKDVVYARARTMQEGSAEKRRAVVEAELRRGTAALVQAKNRIARLKLDKTQEFADFNAEVKVAALGLKGFAGRLARVLAAQQYQGYAVPAHIVASLEAYSTQGVSAERFPNFDHARRVAALRDLELTLVSLKEWFDNTEQALRRP